MKQAANTRDGKKPRRPRNPAVMDPLCVIGLWHQGVVASACLADLGWDVVAADRDTRRITDLNAGKAPLFEPGLDELLRKTLKCGRLRFTSDLAGAVRNTRNILLMFDTPIDDNDQSDLSEIFSSVSEIACGLVRESVILVTAQVPVGTCDQIGEMIRRENPSLKLGIAYIPENLRLGKAIDCFLHPALPVIGANEPWIWDRVERIFSPLNVKWEHVDLRTAEMTKHAMNAFLAASVCFGNELGNLCDEVGADGRRIAEVLRMDPRVGPKAFLSPGLGFSGGTLARDMQTLRGLGDRSGLDTLLLDGAWESNRIQNRIVIRKLRKLLRSLDGVPVAVLGLTYKPGTSTLRRSASLEIIGDMVRAGMRVAAHDPKADRMELSRHTEFRFADDPYDAVAGAQALVLITAWPEYKNLDYERVGKLMARPVIIDVNNMLDAQCLGAMGFTCIGVGRGQ